MREILFRGKTNNGEWVFGDFYKWLKATYIMKNNLDSLGKTNILVIPETVGQYTGLTDKNGTKIFEGDILKPFDEMIVVLWTELFNTLALKVYVEYTEKKRGKEIKETRTGWAMLNDYSLSDAEVIGNIHDNPELLEAQDV